ncbi:hypothetical protein ACLESD_21140 [Pyxidicoccus sp. 3LFB2]
MPTLLMHLTAIERMAANPGDLPVDWVRALAEDLPYARFGAALPDLPLCEGVRGGLSAFLPERELPPFARLYHERAPVGFGLKMAELVATGAAGGNEAGLALAGGLLHAPCGMDRRGLYPRGGPDWCSGTAGRGERARDAHREIEWAQTLFYLRELHGVDLLGTPRLREKCQVVKSPGFPWRGIGRGIYELVRLSSQERVGQAPSKADVDGWVRGLYISGLFLSSPMGRARALPAYAHLSFQELYRNDAFDYSAEVEGALESARGVLRRLHGYMARGTFTPRTRARFLEVFPEGTLGACAA